MFQRKSQRRTNRKSEVTHWHIKIIKKNSSVCLMSLYLGYKCLPQHRRHCLNVRFSDWFQFYYCICCRILAAKQQLLQHDSLISRCNRFFSFHYRVRGGPPPSHRTTDRSRGDSEGSQRWRTCRVSSIVWVNDIKGGV